MTRGTSLAAPIMSLAAGMQGNGAMEVTSTILYSYSYSYSNYYGYDVIKRREQEPIKLRMCILRSWETFIIRAVDRKQHAECFPRPSELWETGNRIDTSSDVPN